MSIVFQRILSAIIQSILVVLIDLQVYRALRRTIQRLHPVIRLIIWILMWGTTAFVVGIVVWYHLADHLFLEVGIRQWIISAVLVVCGSKLFAVVFVLLDDIQFYMRKVIRYFRNRRSTKATTGGKVITRSQFLAKTALVAAAVPFSGAMFGILRGVYDYRIRRRTLYLPNLPAAFDGITIGQISDIHSNANYNRVAVQGGVEMLMNEKPDVIFFTGDLVNFRANEVNEFINIFDKIKAPLGVYSVTGNHDYGNYMWWPSEQARRKNFQDFLAAHKQLGYDILMNEHRFLKTGGEKIAILGVENWGTGRFPKLGRLDLAHAGTEDVPVKLLLSHDPSHWDAQVRPNYPDIDVMFAGHTHGFQLGVEIGDFKWSPAQYAYKQWADLYKEDDQYLYVNRGFGSIGYLGRIGMPPELTIVELKRGIQPA